jgi:hypothetical protein
LVELKIIKHVR